MARLKVGDYTNAGQILWIDDPSPLIPDPLVKVSSTNKVSHRLSELVLVEKPVVPELDEDFKIPLEFNLTQVELLRLLTSIAHEVRTNGYGPFSTTQSFVKHWLYDTLRKQNG